MHTIQIDASPHQIRKLRKGHRVRVKKGEGFNLIVHPATYNVVSRSFAKNKGTELQLTPEEIDMNRDIPEAIKPEAHQARMKKQEESKPINMNTMFGQGINSMKGTQTQVHLADALNHHLGANYGYMARAGLDNAINGAKSAIMAKHGINGRYNLAPMQSIDNISGPHSRMVGGALEKSTVGLKGGMVHSFVPPALVSQPFSANFQMQHFLPPQYQHFNSGGGDMSGEGLYV